jgi:nucleoside-diphosphate-sugar epimerase
MVWFRAMRRVLVTGMSGLIGGAVRRRLEGRVALRALNRRVVEGVETHRADIADLEAIGPAFRDVDTVVHLAANVETNPAIEII